MSLTFDPEVAEALAPMAAQSAAQTPPPVGDGLTRRASRRTIRPRSVYVSEDS
jgi:hypothetical protein